jgi:hypothetical protein
LSLFFHFEGVETSEQSVFLRHVKDIGSPCLVYLSGIDVGGGSNVVFPPISYAFFSDSEANYFHLVALAGVGIRFEAFVVQCKMWACWACTLAEASASHKVVY